MRSTRLATVAAAVLLGLLACGSGATEPAPSPPVPPAAPPPPAPPPPPPPPPPPAPAPVYEYGAKFEPPMGRVVHGMGQWAVYNPKYAALFPAPRQPAAELVFLAIGDSIRPWNPQAIAEGTNTIGMAGRIPVWDIGLRSNQPTAAELAGMADKLFGIDDEVANGSNWDGRLGDLVQVAKNYRKPLMIRIGGEFNCGDVSRRRCRQRRLCLVL